ncbi:MAG: LysR substrate-binding domain-containing protein [Roseibium sp.]
MGNLRQLLPSFRGLVAFEAAGRLGSFTKAGGELGMSQAAVSYAIKALEDDIGHLLFTRGHRMVSLTDAGARLHADVSTGLATMSDGLSAVRANTADPIITLSASTAFATLWMAPRMQALHQDLPNIEFSLHTSDRDLDLAAENIPLGIRRGRPEDWPAYHHAFLAPEEIVAVTSPDYLSNHPIIETPWDLIDHQLAHLDEPHRGAVSWQEWLTSAGVHAAIRARGVRANEYVAVLQLALDGDAIALGWRCIIDVFLKKNRLVEVTSHHLKSGTGFYIVWPKSRELTPEEDKVRQWIIDEHGLSDALISHQAS